jgi:stringent starvation protein B
MADDSQPESGNNGTSTRPYLIRALHEWCSDNGFTPYLAVHVDESVRVPADYVKNHEIVLNVGFEATSGLTLGNDVIAFKARFGGVAREIVVPIDHVVAIYARENGQGMAFPMPAPAALGSAVGVKEGADAMATGPHLAVVDDKNRSPQGEAGPDGEGPPSPPAGPRPALKRVK